MNRAVLHPPALQLRVARTQRTQTQGYERGARGANRSCERTRPHGSGVGYPASVPISSRTAEDAKRRSCMSRGRKDEREFQGCEWRRWLRMGLKQQVSKSDAVNVSQMCNSIAFIRKPLPVRGELDRFRYFCCCSLHLPTANWRPVSPAVGI